ncbi:NUDIX domain-containing protein [Maritalea mediterranea]|uniref:NUDIX domain-containing protein n=1 Tax=Maritalea mediterranea TaxID=2909667 RepID=A0ABS9EA59_9HYPH|nr:NUDIX domain-containing protein [Maritalea mediterranea]MCF4099084.1 NUDIX domain-containing protein [Maritalea mediterranea]
MQQKLYSRWRMRAYLTLIGMWRRMTIGARIMLVDGERVLLIRQTYVRGWQFPGGGVEPGETALEAGMRETFEETGLRVQGSPRLHGVFHNDNGLSIRDHVCFYVATAFDEVHEFRPNAEIVEMGWFHHQDLPEDINDGVRRRVDEYFNNAPPAEKW